MASENNNSFEMFGLMVKVPNETKASAKPTDNAPIQSHPQYKDTSNQPPPTLSRPSIPITHQSVPLTQYPSSRAHVTLSRRSPDQASSQTQYPLDRVTSDFAALSHRTPDQQSVPPSQYSTYRAHATVSRRYSDQPVNQMPPGGMQYSAREPAKFIPRPDQSQSISQLRHPPIVPKMQYPQVDTVSREKVSVEHSFDEMVSEQPSQRGRTFIVLDCANIGWAHGENHFSVAGIRLALAFFDQYKVDVTAFIPASYVKKKPRDGSKGNAVMETDDRQQLENLIRSGDVTVVPAGDHDDVYILSYARSNNGFIVSNDFYVDHVEGIQESSIKRSMKLWLNVNRCGFTFFKNSSFMINPGNVLSTVLGYMSFDERRLDFNVEFTKVIDSLTLSIHVLFQCECYQQLKYVLLARATSYMEVRHAEQSCKIIVIYLSLELIFFLQ